jgi:transposase
MKNKTKRYSEEFRKDAVQLLQNRGVRTVPEIAASVGVSVSMLYRWRDVYGAQGGASAVASQNERDDIEKMRRRLRELEQENALLKKAAALFAREVK